MNNSDAPCPLDCQGGTLTPASRHVPRLFDLVFRARKLWHKEGLSATLAKVGKFLLMKSSGQSLAEPGTRKVNSVIPDEVLNLQHGDYVEVKSEEEILQTLDAHGRHHGLSFLPSMRPFCGKRFPVFKRVERIYLEETGVVRTMKNTVLLDGVYCDGLLMGCDRSCFYYWREAWLRRAPNR